MMILVDTSIWISHLRRSNDQLRALLGRDAVCCHPFIIGELACGNLKNRTEILTLLGALPAAEVAEPEEILPFIEKSQLMGKGLAYVDVHLLASAILSNVGFWTADRPLAEAARSLGIDLI
jgi:hypothetical protein